MCQLQGINQNGTEQKQTTRGVTDGLRQPASQLISSEERPETLKGYRADKQVGRQTDRPTNAPIGRHPESTQTDVQTEMTLRCERLCLLEKLSKDRRTCHRCSKDIVWQPHTHLDEEHLK